MGMKLGWFKCFLGIELAALILGWLPAVATAAETAISPPNFNDLIEHAPRYDGQKIRLHGEVIGDIMHRGNDIWINITDGTNSIGIIAPRAIVPTITFVGDYHTSGDIVEVVGDFYNSDPNYGGDTDVRAYSVKVLEVGSPRAHPISRRRVLATGIAIGIAGILAGIYFKQKNSPDDRKRLAYIE